MKIGPYLQQKRRHVPHTVRVLGANATGDVVHQNDIGISRVQGGRVQDQEETATRYSTR